MWRASLRGVRSRRCGVAFTRAPLTLYATSITVCPTRASDPRSRRINEEGEMQVLDLRELADEMDALVEQVVLEDDDDRARLAELTKLQDELGETLRTVGEDYEPTLIAACDFKEYAQDLADDLGLLADDRQWPLTCIDWEHAARELAYDYTTVTFDGADYMIRSW